jgi:hypothetical protein
MKISAAIFATISAPFFAALFATISAAFLLPFQPRFCSDYCRVSAVIIAAFLQ